ncbi:MAG: terpene cyclase/mutase family protein, partial [Anaerolineaceae bacterium]|nr:terpene cyclase/mutase family protein [Anaerolineaceae bacterium]
AYPAYIVDDSGNLFPGNAGLMLAALATFDQVPAGLSDLILTTLQADGSFSTIASKDFTTGVYTDLSQALAILGLSAAKVTVPTQAVDYLINRQLEDGSWDNGFGSDPDTTAIVVIALISSGQVDNANPAIVKSLDYFRNSQLENGGWRPSWDTDPVNVDTTGWINLALITAGQKFENWEKSSATPQAAILTQLKEDGSIGGTYVNVYSTLEALLGLASAPLFEISVPFVETNTIPAIDNQAGLVVTFPDGSSLLRCVTFTGNSISGYDLLSTSGLKMDSFFDPVKGPGVCAIEGSGCPTNNCFCEMPNYWSYWHLDNETWSYSTIGAGTYEVKPGTVDGWAWGDTALPAAISFSEICGPNAELFLPAIISAQSEETVSPSLDMVTPTAIPSVAVVPSGISTLNYILIAGILVLLVIILVLILRKKSVK